WVGTAGGGGGRPGGRRRGGGPRPRPRQPVSGPAGAEAGRPASRARPGGRPPALLAHTRAAPTPPPTLLPRPPHRPHPPAPARVPPAAGRCSGWRALGGERATIARPLDVPESLAQAGLDLRRSAPGDQHPGWLPLITLGRRLPRAEVQRAVDVLGYDDVGMT